MKKFLYVGIMIFGLCLFTGCGSKVLECSKDNSYSEEMKMIQNVKVTFKKDEVTKLSMDMHVELGENYLEYKEALIESVESEFSSLKDTKGLDYSTESSDNGFTFNLKADMKKMDDEAKAELDIVNTNQSYDNAKSEFESEGYTCK